MARESRTVSRSVRAQEDIYAHPALSCILLFSFTEQFSPTARRYLCLPKTGPYKPPIEALHKPGEDADRQFKTASSDAENFSYHDTQSVLEEGQHHPLDEGDVFTGSSSRSDSTLPSSKFIQQLAAAKNKNRMPEHMRSTGALKGLSTFAVFNHQGRGRSEGQSFKQPVSSHCDKSRLQPSVPQVDVAKRQARALADVNPSQCQNLFQSRKAAEYLESARVPAPEHKFSTQYQFTEQEAELDRPVPKAIEPARSPAAAGDPSDSVETLLPLARGGGEDGSAAMASSCPSDGVAKRLASIAQQQISPKKTVMITSPTSSTSCKESKAPTHPIFGLTKSTKMDGPKAGRVAVVISKAAVGSNVRRAPAQRQVGASRVERVPHRSTKEIEADLSQKNGAVGSTSVRETSGGNHEVSHVVANGSAAQTKFSKGNYKAANRPMPSSPKKIGPVKTIGKVVSSTTQSLGAKSKILNSSSAGRRATTISAQAAREAVVAKKQAEVAKLRAEAKARNKKAAVCAAETHASMQARTRRLRAATQSNNHNAEQFAPKVASPADGQTEGVPTVQAARLLDTLDLNIPVSRVHADGEVVRKGDENTDDRPERHGLQIDFSATLEVIKSPAEHKQHSPGQHNCAKCVDRDAESPTLTDQSPQAAEESIPARSILSDDLALAFANLTPFRRCRRPNGALDSPADKIRVQMALLFGMSAREENGQSGYGQIGPPLSAQEKALSSPIRGAFDAGCARSALGQHTANGALRGWQSCNTSPLKSRRQIQLCWKETSKENVVCAAENSVAAAWDDGLLR